MENIITRLTPIMHKVFEDNSIVIKPELTAKDVEKWTSMTNVIFIAEVEKEFGFKFHFRDVMGLKNVGDLLNVIQKKIA
ncbi:MAG: acyl carrier protein [Flavobacteriales bacterium]